MKKLILTLLMFPLSLFGIDLTLSWDANPETNISHYNLYYGQSQNYLNNTKVNVGNVTTYKLTGLSELTTYYFNLTAVNTNSLESPPSDQVTYTTPSSLKLLTATSRRTHGNKGDFDIPLSTSETGPIPTECRNGTSFTIVLMFNKNISSGNVKVVTRTGKKAVIESVTKINNTIVVKLTSVSDVQLFRLSLSDIKAIDNTLLPAAVVRGRILIGDVNGDKYVNATDKNMVESNLSMVTSPSNFRNDINASGNITSIDLQSVVNHLGNVAP